VSKRRSRGEGGMHWDANRKRWIVTLTVGFDARGKRITRKASAETKTEAKTKLKELQREYDDGLMTSDSGYTVSDAITYWLTYGLSGRAARTVEMYRTYSDTHIIPALGKRKLRELTVEDVEKLLAGKAGALSTRSLRIIHSILCRAVRKAQARDKVRRNVVLLCEVPEGRAGRPSKALTLHQAEAVLKAAERAPTRIGAYIIVSLLTGARTEEMRALRWHNVDLEGRAEATPPIPPNLALIRSVRAGGDTKTRKSRRGLQLPQRAITALRALWSERRCGHADMIECPCLVFATRNGTPLEAHNVQRDFRKVVDTAGQPGREWTPRELRHSFVSLLSDARVPVEVISRLVGHRSTNVTETVYRKQLRPVVEGGANTMNLIFPGDEDEDDEAGGSASRVRTTLVTQLDTQGG
jgi:integrase